MILTVDSSHIEFHVKDLAGMLGYFFYLKGFLRFYLAPELASCYHFSFVSSHSVIAAMFPTTVKYAFFDLPLIYLGDVVDLHLYVSPFWD